MSSEHVISITLDEALTFANTSMSVEPFRDPEQYDRFEVHAKDAPDDVEKILNDSKFDGGTFHWVAGDLEALVLAKVLRAEGFEAVTLWDMAENPPGTPSGWAILTSRAPGS